MSRTLSYWAWNRGNNSYCKRLSRQPFRFATRPSNFSANILATGHRHRNNPMAIRPVKKDTMPKSNFIAPQNWRHRSIKIADLFCGAGGTSTGAVEAIELLGHRPELTAVNHWDRAIETHTANHPGAKHLLTAVDNVNPKEHFKEGELDILWASPECTHHSVARGGRPINEQSRATAWCVVRWAGDLSPDIILVENVPEFVTWGGIGANGRPLKNKKGKTFMAWVSALESLGYRVGWRVLCAADYGDPTTRRRLFVMAVRGKRKIVWPEPTHSRVVATDLDMFGAKRKPWVPAREIIDWSLQGQSIYDRKKPLSDKTMRRIMTGLNKFGLKPFIVPQTNGVRSADAPAPTVTTTSRGVGMCEPIILSAGGPDCPARPVSEPLGTVLTRDHRAIAEPFIIGAGGPEYAAKPKRISEPLNTVIAEDRRGLVEPFLVNMKGQSDAADVDQPVPTLTAHAPHIGVAEPFLVNLKGGSDSHIDASASSLDDPTPAVCANGNHVGVAEPFIVGGHGSGDEIHEIERPLTAVATHLKHGICQPFLVPSFGENGTQKPRTHSVDEPLPTVAATGHIQLAEPYILAIDHRGGNGDYINSVHDPLSTVSTKARHCVAEPFLVQLAHGESAGEKNPEKRRVKSIHDPLPTVHAGGKGMGICQPELSRSKSINEPMPTICGNRGDVALIEPSLLPQHGGGVLRSVDQPTPTVTTDGAIGVVEPFLMKYYGAATGAQSVNDPLDTVTAKERHALVRPTVVINGERYLLDIRFRMLQPHELAGAQGFPKTYKFAGTKTDQVKLIGNAVPRRMARALVLAAITQQGNIAQFIDTAVEKAA
jgi:DNA (cytosine-5)-methyltransferase 1